MGWKWSVKSQRYHDAVTGRFLPNAQVLEWTRESIAATELAIDPLAEMVHSRVISPAHWQSVMREEIKREYIRQYTAGIGGRNAMNQADWGRIGGWLKSQYNTYLEPFTQAIANGELSEAQIRWRANQYIESAKRGFETAQEIAAVRANNDEVIWVQAPGAEHCPDCDAFARMGWQKIADDPYSGAVPCSGDTQCLMSCQCHLEYRNSLTEEVYGE